MIVESKKRSLTTILAEMKAIGKYELAQELIDLISDNKKQTKSKNFNKVTFKN
jgi:hypothetical protein